MLGVTLAFALSGGPRGGVWAGTARAEVAPVLAVDASGTVDDSRFKLQREEIAARESGGFAEALSGGANQAIEVAVLFSRNSNELVCDSGSISSRGDTTPARPLFLSVARFAPVGGSPAVLLGKRRKAQVHWRYCSASPSQ